MNFRSTTFALGFLTAAGTMVTPAPALAGNIQMTKDPATGIETYTCPGQYSRFTFEPNAGFPQSWTMTCFREAGGKMVETARLTLQYNGAGIYGSDLEDVDGITYIAGNFYLERSSTPGAVHISDALLNAALK